MSRGYTLEDIEEVEDGFLVEDNIMFELGKDYGSINSNNTRQTIAQNTIRPDIKTIIVDLDPGLSSSWRVATFQAMLEWENICGLSFRAKNNSDQYSHTRVFYDDSISKPKIAIAGYPSHLGEPGERIRINADDYSHYNLDRKTAIPLFRYKNKINGKYHFTTNASEIGYANSTYKFSRITGYLYKNNSR